VIPTFERSLNLNNTETREGNKARGQTKP